MEKILDSRDFLRLLEEVLKSGKGITFMAKGDSMSPFIRHGDNITVRPLDRPLRVGDVVLVRSAGGGALVHRVVSVRHGTLVTRGDASGVNDPPCRLEDVLGRVVRVEGKGYNFHLDFPYGYLIARWFGFLKHSGVVVWTCRFFINLLRLR